MSCNSSLANTIIPRGKLFIKKKEFLFLNLKTSSFLVLKRKSMAVSVISSSSSPSPLILTSGASGRINALFSVRALKSLLILINAVVLFLLLPFRIGVRRKTVVLSSSSSSSTPSSVNDKDCIDKSLVNCSSTKVRVPATIVPWKSGSVDQAVVGRRALAIRRVLQDDDVETVREYFLFVNSSGETIFTQLWSPKSCKIRGLVILMHGLNEHSGRYNDFAKQLNANGFKVYGMDWIGHGGSDGLHAYVHSLDYAVDDLKLLIDKVVGENSPGLPCFCFGHSTGAAIVLKAMLDPKVEAQIAGVVLTSPAVGVNPSHPIFVVLAPVFSFLFPRLQLRAANNQGAVVSRDPEALLAKYSDPLVYTGAIRVRTGYEILRITTYLQQNLSRFKVPFLVLHGTADVVTDPEASQKLYDEASSTDKSIKLYEGLLHDLLFEPEREDVANVIVDWLNSRV